MTAVAWKSAAADVHEDRVAEVLDEWSVGLAHEDRPLPEIQAAKGFAKVGRAFVWARRNGRLAKSPEPGDIFLISHDGNNGHTGIVKTVNRDGTVTTLEGNTNTAGSRTGDGVYERTRLVASINAGFVRIGGELTVLDAWDGADMFADLDSRRSGKTRPRKNRKPRQRSRKGRR